jgi:hypothetical protein
MDGGSSEVEFTTRRVATALVGDAALALVVVLVIRMAVLACVGGAEEGTALDCIALLHLGAEQLVEADLAAFDWQLLHFLPKLTVQILLHWRGH